MKMHYSLLATAALICGPLLLVTGLDEKRHRAECQMWSKLENKTLPLQDKGHANCTTNEECTGFKCVGVYQEKDLSFGMRVLPCQDPPGVEIFGFAPQLNTKNFSHVFTHKSQYEVPGALLNASMLPGVSFQGHVITGKLEVHIEKNPDGKSLMMGLIARGCINKTCIFEKSVFNHTKIPVPECTNQMDHSIRVNSVCSINHLDGCGKNQICVQESTDGDVGLCECRSGYVQQNDGTCLSKKEDDEEYSRLHPLPSSPKSASTKSQPHTVGGDAETASAGGGGAIVAGIVSILLVLLIVGAGAFIVFRTRLAPRLRARLTNTPYEQQNVIA